MRLIKRIVVFLLIFVNACVEHQYFIHLSPDGSYYFEYKANGDRKDLLDLDVPLPQGRGWIVNSTFDEDVESYNYTALRMFNKNEILPNSFYSGDSLYKESLLSHPIKINYTNLFVKETYSLNIRFENRNVDKKYPKVMSLINNPENPENGWAYEIYKYLFSETLFNSPIGFNQQGMILTDLNTWLNEEISIIPDSLLFENFSEYKEIGLDIIMQPINPIYYDSMDSIFKQLNDEVHITLDLIDDEFEFSTLLPGDLVSTNSHTTKEDTLFWTYSLKDFMDKDYVLSASSQTIHLNRVKIVILLFFGMVVSILVWRAYR